MQMNEHKLLNVAAEQLTRNTRHTVVSITLPLTLSHQFLTLAMAFFLDKDEEQRCSKCKNISLTYIYAQCFCLFNFFLQWNRTPSFRLGLVLLQRKSRDQPHFSSHETQLFTHSCSRGVFEVLEKGMENTAREKTAASKN